MPPGAFAAAWIEDLADSGISAGCGGANLLPGPHGHARADGGFPAEGEARQRVRPAAGLGRLRRRPASSPFAAWIEELAAEGVTAGCGGGNYCPDSANTRGQMAVFLTKTFGLRLYGP